MMYTISEWVGPRCSRPISRSMSGSIEARKSSGMFTLTFASLEAALPER